MSKGPRMKGEQTGPANREHKVRATDYTRLPEKAAGPGAKKNWELARQALEQASLNEDSVPESERPKLTYRLAKVGYYTGDVNDRVIEGLEKTVDNPAVNRAEGYK